MFFAFLLRRTRNAFSCIVSDQAQMYISALSDDFRDLLQDFDCHTPPNVRIITHVPSQDQMQMQHHTPGLTGAH